MDSPILDIAHVSFLELIRTMIQQTGAANTKGSLIRLAVQAGEGMPPQEYPTLEDFVGTFLHGTNPVVQIEGRATYLGGGLFGLPACPFAKSIAAYGAAMGKLPENYGKVVEEYNKETPTTEALHVGCGSGVSPFCSVHQPMRSAVASKIQIAGRPLTIYQLGCKSGSGKKAFADRWIQEGGWSKEAVDKILDSAMCCYGVKAGS